MTVEEIVAKVRLNLGSPSQQVVPDAELLTLINEGQYDIVKEGAILRGSAHFPTIVDRERYAIPSDSISLLRVDYDGNKIDLIEYDQIDELDVT
tara:strand:- start:97 stop:378 length:282 start_codon:yes stop_codon:yes gene_type:complete